MNALLNNSRFDVDIFESAPEFSERGAAVGIAKNGQEALDEIGGTVVDALDRAGAVTMSSSRMYMVCSKVSSIPPWYSVQIPLR